MKKIPVIIDCDPGHDDMVALVLACGNDRLDIKAVTTVAGNKDIDHVTNNALNILHYIGRDDIPVAKGYLNPMVREYNRGTNTDVPDAEKANFLAELDRKDPNGLAGFQFPPCPNKISNLHSVEMIADVVRKTEEKITLIPVGPLTNIGFFIQLYPDLLPKIQQISIMGGTCNYLFKQPFMEFNTFMDPEATKIVFESEIPILMHGYDVTYQAVCGPEEVQRFESIGNDTSKMVVTLMKYFGDLHRFFAPQINMKGAIAVHDACAVASVIDPSVIKSSKKMNVIIQTAGEFMDGATICNDNNVLSDQPKNAEVVFEFHKEMFFDMLYHAISKLK